jgi:hypothetical protein
MKTYYAVINSATQEIVSGVKDNSSDAWQSFLDGRYGFIEYRLQNKVEPVYVIPVKEYEAMQEELRRLRPRKIGSIERFARDN